MSLQSWWILTLVASSACGAVMAIKTVRIVLLNAVLAICTFMGYYISILWINNRRAANAI